MRIVKNAFVISVVAVAILGFCLSSNAMAQTVGVFNLEKALADSKKGKSASDKFKSRQEALAKDYDTKYKALQKKFADFSKTGAAMSQDAAQKKEQELLKERDDLLSQQQKGVEELEKSYNDNIKPLLEKVQTAVNNIAKEKGLMLVLEGQESGVWFADSSLDLTADISKAIDK
jgi:outer membrane protein